MIILYAILIAFAIPFILALFTKSKYVIERGVTINKPQAYVFNYIKFLKNQDQYNKWVMTDPGMKKDFTGTDGATGFIYAWDSENKQVGKGAQEIIKINKGLSVDTEVRFEKPFKGISHTTIEALEVSANQTNVRWIFTGQRNYMMKVMHYFLNLKKILGKDMQTSLMTLKGVLEK